MESNSLLKRAKKEAKRVIKKLRASDTPGKVLNILLLTNRDSDNVGDQVIEACDIALIKAAMKNLGISSDSYKITSRSASLIPKKYISTQDPALLERARRLISRSDLVFFGGAPLFNYLYQVFYERTAKTIELAKEYGKPVVFSAIGVERYDEDNPRCQRLKETLNFDNVKRITTRDGIQHLEKYKTNPNLFIDKVSDPAVFSKWVFKNYLNSRNVSDKKKIGIFIIRANAFLDNKFDFTWQDAATMWVSLGKELDGRGYDYEFLTSGHFGDEAFLDKLNMDFGIPSDKCIPMINCPEDLMRHMSDYDAIISCRLHPSIIAFSMGLPSVSLVWNPKVKGFYESIGYDDRTIEVAEISAKEIADRLEKAMGEGVKHDNEYLLSVYKNIYYGLQDSFDIKHASKPVYTYDELLKNLPTYAGTSKKEMDFKLRKKFHRVYQTYNQAFDKNESLKKQLADN